MSSPRLQRATLPDGRRIHCVRSGEVGRVQEQIEGYFRHGVEVGPGDTVFDAGANIGLFALEAAQRGATVHAFEPLPITYAALAANAKELGEGKIVPHQMGLGARSEIASFAYFRWLTMVSTRFPDTTREQGASVIRAVFDDPKQTPRCGWFRRAPEPFRRWFVGLWVKFLFAARTVKCPVEPVSRLIEKLGLESLDLLKIDVEGAEWDVLEGICEADWSKIQQVVVEVHDEDGRLKRVLERLEANGLSQQAIEEEPGAEQWGVFLVWARR